MDNLNDLISMGFTVDEIREANERGFYATNEVIDYIVEKRSKAPSLVLRPIPKNADEPQPTSSFPMDIHNEEEERELEKRRAEAVKLHEKKLEERKNDEIYKQSLLNQIKEDRKKGDDMQKPSVSAVEPSKSAPKAPDSSFKIRINLTGVAPFTKTFEMTAKVHELIDTLKEKTRSIPNICDSTSLQAECLSIMLGSWPRRSLNITDYLTKQENRLNEFTELVNSNIFIEHNPTICQPPGSLESPDSLPVDPEVPEPFPRPQLRPNPPRPDSDNENENEGPNSDDEASEEEEDFENFRGQGQRVSERVFENDEERQRDFEERRRNFLDRFNQPMDADVAPHKPSGRILNPSNLMDLCISRVISIISKVVQVTSSAQIGVPGSHQDENMTVTPQEVKLFNTLKTTYLPDYLAQKILAILKNQNLFNTKTAAIFKHSLEELNLDYYTLMSGDLLSFIAKNLTHLKKFSVNGIDIGCLPPPALNELRNMKNLTKLSLNNLSSVNSSTLNSIFDIPGLKSLNIGRTKLCDESWKQFTAPFSDSLTELNVFGLDETYSITDAGFWQILDLFPKLESFNCSKNRIKGSPEYRPDSFLGPKPFLKTLNLSGNQELVQIPECSSVLEQLSIGQCYALDINLLIGFCRRFGKNIKRIDDFTTLAGSIQDKIIEFYGLKMAMEEYDLTSLNSPWMNLSTLITIIDALDTTHVRTLKLPQRNLEFKFNDEASSQFISKLESMKLLEELNIGDQISWIGLEDLSRFVQFSRTLKVLHIKSASKTVVNILESALKTECKLRVQVLME